MTKCRSLGCSRTVPQSSSGTVMAHCIACTKRYLSDAFGDHPRPRRWFDRAAAGDLPTSIVGGVPTDAPAPAPSANGSNPTHLWPTRSVLGSSGGA